MDLPPLSPALPWLMTGAPRSLPRLLKALQARFAELGSRAEVDLFLHSWRPGEGWSPEVTAAIEALGPRSVDSDERWVRDMPLPWPGWVGDDEVTARLESFVAMWASAARGFAPMSTEENRRGQRYDWVIRTRPDLLWDIAGEFSATLRDGINRIPRIYCASPAPADVAAVLSRDDAERYFALYPHMHDLDIRVKAKGLGAFVAEYALEVYLDWQGVRWSEFPSPLVIVRTNGDLHWFRIGAGHRAYYAARSAMAYQGDNLPLSESTDILNVPRITTDLSMHLFNGGTVPEGFAERVTAVWHQVREADPAAMRMALRLADGISELRRRPASLAPVGIAHQTGHLLRAEGARRLTLFAGSPRRMIILALRILRYRVEERLAARRWFRRLASPRADRNRSPW